MTETAGSISGSEASRLVIDEDFASSLSDDAKSIERINTKNDKVDGDDLNLKKRKETDDKDEKIEVCNGNKRKYNRKIIECHQCHKVFKSLEALAYHSFNDHGEKYKCFWCPETFDTMGLMKIHKKIHDRRSRGRKINNNVYDDINVPVNEDMIQKSTFKSRIEKNNNDDDKVNDKNNAPASVAKIIEKKESRSRIEDDRDDVRHDDGTEAIKTKEEKRLKFCRSKKWIRNFILHKCDICKSTFETKQKLNRHKRNHISKNICNLCNCAFTTESRLYMHQQSDHSSNKTDVDESRVCFFCNKVFASSKRRFIHEKKIHWEIR